MSESRTRKEKFPNDGEIITGKISPVKDDVDDMELLECGSTPGLISGSALSKKRLESNARITEVGNVEICQSIKVDEIKGFVDLIPKRAGDKEKQECKVALSKTKLAYQTIGSASKLSEQPIKDIYETFSHSKKSEYGTLFSYFANDNNNINLLDSEPNGRYSKEIIEEQYKASSFKPRVDDEFECRKSGVIGFKKNFSEALKIGEESEMVLAKSPTCSIIKVCFVIEEAFRIINESCEAIKENIETIGGTFNIVNPAKVYGDNSKNNILFDERQLKKFQKVFRQYLTTKFSTTVNLFNRTIDLRK